jgi:hypothetical protein
MGGERSFAEQAPNASRANPGTLFPALALECGLDPEQSGAGNIRSAADVAFHGARALLNGSRTKEC